MESSFNFALLCFTSFFTLMNPLGVMPVFLTMTNELSSDARTATARKAVLVAFLTLMAFAFSGQLLFEFFGISSNSFRIVGGVIFFLMGQDMLQARLVSFKVSPEEVKGYVSDISVTPLAIPMICGPGSITNAIVLMEDSQTLLQKAILIGSIALVCVLTFIVLWAGSRISKFLGETGNKILMRLMGLIVMVIAVEFFFAGLRPFLDEIIQRQP
ncbi:MAG: MarC family protein [Bernardetiaceae bacterium]